MRAIEKELNKEAVTKGTVNLSDYTDRIIRIIQDRRININTGSEVKPSEVGEWAQKSIEKWRYALTHKTWVQKLEMKITKNEQRKVFTDWRANVRTFLSGSRGLFDRSITKKARSLDMEYDEVSDGSGG